LRGLASLDSRFARAQNDFLWERTHDMSENEDALGVNRRDFLKSSSFATLMTMLGGVQLLGQTPPVEAPSGDAKIKLAVIGLGAWGREILTALGKLERADTAAICDSYGASVRRSSTAAPGAVQVEDYKKILENKDIKAVIIATPTHQHAEIAIAALKAGKHVYCEAPLANTIEDARAIAIAARDAKRQVFQAGLQMRADPQRHFLLPFIRSRALGEWVMARAQWHKKQSWRAASSNAEREKALNWRLNKEVSLGLLGEVAIHQVDQAGWFMNARPVSVSAIGSNQFWKDREVADTVHALFEFPNRVQLAYDCSLANSFDADYEMYYGSDAAVMLRENKAWMFKEVDSPLLGWEVYARKDDFYRETGIALKAGGSKQTSLDEKVTSPMKLEDTALYNALDRFLRNAIELGAAEEDAVSAFGAEDKTSIDDQVSRVKARLRPTAGFLDGFQATVMAVKANEAVVTGNRIQFKPDWFELA
jgi:predicted dehydrogenase